MPTWTVKASLFALFAIYCIWMMMSWGKWESEDGTVTKLLVVLGAAIFFGFLTLIYIIPMIGELTSSFFYSSGELIETDENMRGAVLLAQGNYEGAIEEYRKKAERHPDERFPIVEMSTIYLENLKDPQSALEVLQGSLDKEWEADDAAFLLFKIADIQTDHLAQFDEARETLGVVVEQIPDSRHSANATHKLHEIEEKEVIANQRVARGESAIPQDEEKSDGDSKEATRLQREQEEREFLEKLQSNRGTGSRGGDGEDQAS